MLKRLIQDFPGHLVVKDPSSNAGDTSSISGQGIKIPYAARQLKTLEPQLLESVCSGVHPTRELSGHREEPMCHNERSCMLQLQPDSAK